MGLCVDVLGSNWMLEDPSRYLLAKIYQAIHGLSALLATRYSPFLGLVAQAAQSSPTYICASGYQKKKYIAFWVFLNQWLLRDFGISIGELFFFFPLGSFGGWGLHFAVRVADQGVGSVKEKENMRERWKTFFYFFFIFCQFGCSYGLFMPINIFPRVIYIFLP